MSADGAFGFRDDAISFFQQPLDCFALLSRRLLADRFEHGLECFDLSLSLDDVVFQGRLQVGV